MASYRSRDDFPGMSHDHRLTSTHVRNDRSGRMYEDRPSPRDRQYRSSQSPQRRTPPYDRGRTPPRGVTTDWHGHPPVREWDIRSGRENGRRYENGKREKSPRPRPGAYRGYHDRDREGYKSPRYRSRSRARSPHYGGPPSREVMMDGLPADMAEEDILTELKLSYNVEGLENVRVIRDRQTKLSRGFGFIRFPSIEESRAFVEQNYPTIQFHSKGSADGDRDVAKVRIAFSRDREERGRTDKADGEWTCSACSFVNFPGRRLCYKCQSSPPDNLGAVAQSKNAEFLNSGDSDASLNGAPSQFLLLRGLEPTVTEDLLAKGVAKLYKPSSEATQTSAASSKKGSAKVASTTGDANLGAKEGSLRRVLLVRGRRSGESWRYGFAEFVSVEDAQAALTRFNSFEKFTISSKPVIVCYIHAGVFVPDFSTEAGNERFTFSPLGNTATNLAYWDKDAYVSELVVSMPASIKAVEARSKRGADKAAGKAAAAAEKEGLLGPSIESELKAKKRKTETKDATKPKKTVPAHLQFWSNRHAELHGVQSPDMDTSEAGTHASQTSDEDPITARSYTDLTKKCCYLCSRQFKSEAEVKKHERVSQLHRDNLTSEDLKNKATVKMAKAGLARPLNGEDDTSEYRDRAKERRAAFGLPKKVNLPMKKAALSAAEAGDRDGGDEPAAAPSKGASLLGKMGWAAGEGLGAQGTGVTAPIVTDMYVQGVGLGAKGGKLGDAAEEAERNTKGGYSDFLERTKEKAKERFDQLS